MYRDTLNPLTDEQAEAMRKSLNIGQRPCARCGGAGELKVHGELSRVCGACKGDGVTP